MKKNIVVCCEAMDEVRIDACAVTTLGPDRLTYLVLWKGTREQRSFIHFCPWCGKELPFPYKEEA